MKPQHFLHSALLLTKSGLGHACHKIGLTSRRHCSWRYLTQRAPVCSSPTAKCSSHDRKAPSFSTRHQSIKMAGQISDYSRHNVRVLKDLCCDYVHQMDVVVAGQRHGATEHVIFFGGDVQDYPENMLSHRDNGKYIRWNILATAGRLCERFPSAMVLVVKPHHMHLKTFSVYSQFVQSSDFGVPTHTPDYGSWRRLGQVYREAVGIVLGAARDNAAATPDTTATNGCSQADDSADKTNNFIGKVDDGADKTSNVYSQADDGTYKTNNGCSQVDDGTDKTNNGCSQAVDGTDKTNNGCSQADDATDKTNNGCACSQADNGTDKTNNLCGRLEDGGTNRPEHTASAEGVPESASAPAVGTSNAAHNGSPLPEVPVKLIGFSKGCIVLNQLLHELEATEENSDVQEFISRVDLMIWLDGGHSGGSNTWVTDPAVLERFGRLKIDVEVHVTPYQMKDEMRRWISKEKRKFVQLLQETGTSVKDTLRFDGEPKSIENHFRILEVF